jgi:hypothetical protein
MQGKCGIWPSFHLASTGRRHERAVPFVSCTDDVYTNEVEWNEGRMNRRNSLYLKKSLYLVIVPYE